MVFNNCQKVFKFINYNSCIYKCNKYTLIMIYITKSSFTLFAEQGHRGCDHMVVEFTTTYAISTYHHSCWVWVPLRWGVLDTTLCDKVCQWFAKGRGFLRVLLAFSINKSDWQDITEILLKVALNTITLTLTFIMTQMTNGSFTLFAEPYW